MKWDNRAVRDITRGPAADNALLDIGWEIATIAAVLAPKESGGGASSIRAELVRVNGVAEVRVSYDQDHWYMGLYETGAEDIAPRPFLRPAAGRFR